MGLTRVANLDTTGKLSPKQGIELLGVYAPLKTKTFRSLPDPGSGTIGISAGVIIVCREIACSSRRGAHIGYGKHPV